MKSMAPKAMSAGAVHGIPAHLRKVLISDPAARAKWEDITALARNEWICWVISVKKSETRRHHIERVRTELKEGMRRPCCWPGCPHRSNRDGGLLPSYHPTPQNPSGMPCSLRTLLAAPSRWFEVC